MTDAADPTGDGRDRAGRPFADDLDVDVELAAMGMTLAEVEAAIEEIEANLGRSLGESLGTLWQVPEGLEGRVANRAWRKIADRQAMFAFGDLFGLGWQTAKAVIDPAASPQPNGDER